jgi:hypothetical protein
MTVCKGEIPIIYLSSQVALLVFTSVSRSAFAAELRKKVNADIVGPVSGTVLHLLWQAIE